MKLEKFNSLTGSATPIDGPVRLRVGGTSIVVTPSEHYSRCLEIRVVSRDGNNTVSVEPVSSNLIRVIATPGVQS